MLNANSAQTNLLVTVLVLAMVFLLPWADRRVCRKLGLNLEGGLSRNENAETLLKARQVLLCLIFGLYLGTVAWLVFFSRSAARDYQVHVALFEELQHSVQIDLGPIGFVRAFFVEGLRGALSHIRVVSAEDIRQAYMNVMLFVPMGYLLPYLFSWFRERVRLRPVVCCFVISLLIENLQLVTRRGFYDVDDLAANTLGGFLGQTLFVSVAYVVTHPAWRKELRSYRRWKRNAKARTLYPFVRKLGVSRTTLQAVDEEQIWDFYVMKLGFRLIRQLVPMDSEGTDLLLALGRSQVEFHCSNHPEPLKEQTLTLSARRLSPIIRRLKQNGIPTGDVSQDPYTGLRRVSFEAPDGVTVWVMETGRGNP